MRKSSTQPGSLSAEKRKLLEWRLKQKGISTPGTQEIPRRKETGPCPLSFAQQRLWFLDKLEPESTAYLIPRVFRLGEVDAHALERTLQELIDRHESLRTTFEERAGQPVQVIHPISPFTLPIVDLQGLSYELREQEARRVAQQETQCPYDLTKGPLLRTYALRLGLQVHVLLLTLHHIITDGWSNQVLEHELTTVYQAFVAGQPSPLTPLPIQYADYALWQRKWLQENVLEKQLAYWKAQLQGVPAILSLPTDYLRSPTQSFRGAVITKHVPLSLCERLKVLSQQEDVTLFMTLLSGLAILLGRYNGQQDIVVGTAIANRMRTETEGLIGFFVNTLVLRCNLMENPTVRELLQRVRKTTGQAYIHQDLPFEKLVEELRPERSLSHHPLFQVMFILHNQVDTRDNSFDIQMNGQKVDSQAVKRDLAIAITETSNGLVVSWQYDAALFSEEKIQRALNQYVYLLEQLVAQPQHKLSELSLLNQLERDLMLNHWNFMQQGSPYTSIMQWFDAQVTNTPDTVALVCGQQYLSYAKLEELANRISHRLQRLGIGPDTRVGLCLERSLELPVGLFGILKAGGAYVPLDPSYPRERLAFVVENAQIEVLLTQRNLSNHLSLSYIRVIYLDNEWMNLTTEPITSSDRAISAENIAYVIYTSGSTGQPKGVMVTHSNVNHYVYALASTLHITSHDIYLHTASFSFSSSVRQLLVPLSQGATVVLASSEQISDPFLLFTFIQQQQISVLDLVPSYWYSCVQALLTLEDTTREKLLDNHVRLLLTASEPLLPSLPLLWKQKLAHPSALTNMFGQTETTGIVATYALETYQPGQETSVPIGHPIDSCQIYLLDIFGQPTPVGVQGEVHVGGYDLARGYLGNPELTAERFIPHPFSSEPGNRLYRTGDLARYRSDGTIEFLGRADAQVKVRGYRIELAEIEAALCQHPTIQASIVLAWENVPGEKQLVAYVVVHQGQKLSDRELRIYLQKYLPSYMIPSAFVSLDALPLTPNGKVDRQALPNPEETLNAERGASEEARAPIEELLVGIWSEVLGRKQIGIYDNFFALGGHSLLATQLVARVRATLEVEIGVRVLFEAPTVAELAQRIEQVVGKKEGRVMPPLGVMERSAEIPLSFAQQRLWFLEQLALGGTAYLVPRVYRLGDELDVRSLEVGIEALIHRHESLRTTFSERAGRPVQIIHAAAPHRLPVIDLQWIDHEGREREERRLTTQEAGQPCDLSRGPLLRTHLLRLQRDGHVLLLTLHHIITDGWSNRVMVREMITLYHASVERKPSPLPPLPIQYADYALWQREWLQGEVLEAQVAYWTRRLGGVPAMKLPTDYPRPPVANFRAGGHPFALSAELSQALVVLSRQEGVTLFMLLLAALQVLFYRLTEQTDIVIGTDSAGRQQVEMEGIIGFFVNVLALRTDLSGNPTFRALLKRVREVTLGAYAHQDTPFDLLVEKLASERNLDRQPLVQVLFVLQNGHMEAGGSREREAEAAQEVVQPALPRAMEDEETLVKFDVALFMWERGGKLFGTLNYRLDLFKASTIALMTDRFEVLLQSIVKEPDMLIHLLECISERERTQQEQKERELRPELRLHDDGWLDLSDRSFTRSTDS
jgi:amino acid adenylation domain-containing protein